MGEAIRAASPWMILPFGSLLAVMAFAPVRWPDWWAKHYAKACGFFGAITLAYYIFGLRDYARVAHMAHEYATFIILIGSLFVVAGGIHIDVNSEATPIANTGFLLLGALLANLLGTTGASVLLVRPWLRMNRDRVGTHHVVFFIFLVSNVGGCLTPIGDPPLFLGYLQGVPFWWVAENCWPMWAVAVGFLLALFYVVDARHSRRNPATTDVRQAGGARAWKMTGLGNMVFLAVILGAVFIRRPDFLSEGVMIAAAVGSYLTTGKQIHSANRFDWHPLQEVGVLFAAIFATMPPALDWLQVNAHRLSSPSPGLFYWGSGLLSSVLDNAPTYLGFLSAAFGRFAEPETVEQVRQLVQNHGGTAAALAGAHADEIRRAFEWLQSHYAALLAGGKITTEQIKMALLLANKNSSRSLLAISLGAVFFGANTYLGNGPNFMVRAIAEHEHVRTPSFLGFAAKYTLPCMIPMLLLVWWLFLRR
jgi:Na+/H+ antiporter NhaD/arsenite permease-like protein